MVKPEYLGTGDFKVTMPIARTFMKSVDGNERMYVAGVASSTDLDLDGERMAESAVQAFKKAVDEGYLLPNGTWSMVPLRTEHQKGWNDNLGWIVKADIDQYHNLWIEAELDETSSAARDLFAKLTRGDRPGKPLQLGFSVGGSIKKASREWDATIGRSVRIIEDVTLKEISVVSQPANPTTYVEALTKSVNWEDVPPPKEELTEGTTLKELSMSNDKNRTSDLVKAEVQTDTADVETVEKAEEQIEEAAVADTQTVATEKVAAEGATAEKTVTEKPVTEDDAQKSVYYSEEGTNLLDLFTKLSNQVEEMKQLMNAEKSAIEKTEEKVETVVEKSVEDKVTEAVVAALAAFQKDHLDSITADITALKSVVEEVSSQPIDKSFSVRAAKEGEDAFEKFHSTLKNDPHGSIIGAAVRAATRTQ